MQYLVKGLMVSIADVIIGAFCGMFLHIAYAMMIGSSAILGMVLFFAGIIACIVYSFLLKKFVMNSELSITISVICLILGIWIGWNFNVYA